ncbi:AraC family transcriptional regulator [Paenibacillus cremeus]|nr:AraC family transcriptional regulator [Paenibacillus cremeus]
MPDHAGYTGHRGKMLGSDPFRMALRRTSASEYRPTYHAHQGLELLYVYEGRGRVVVNQRVIEVTPGTLLMFQPFQLHRIQMDVTVSTPYVRSFVIFEPTVLEPYLQPFAGVHKFFTRVWKGFPAFHAIRTGSRAPFLEQLFEELGRIIAEEEPNDEHYSAEERFAVFLVTFLQTIQPFWREQEEVAEQAELRDSPHVETILQWIEDHYRTPFRMEQLAEAVHLSPKYISALFTKMIGSSITEYIMSRRIRQACVLLRSGVMQIQDIAQEIGLTNVSYFCQLFKQTVGVSPHQYRKQAR